MLEGIRFGGRITIKDRTAGRRYGEGIASVIHRRLQHAGFTEAREIQCQGDRVILTNTQPGQHEAREREIRVVQNALGEIATEYPSLSTDNAWRAMETALATVLKGDFNATEDTLSFYDKESTPQPSKRKSGGFQRPGWLKLPAREQSR